MIMIPRRGALDFLFVIFWLSSFIGVELELELEFEYLDISGHLHFFIWIYNLSFSIFDGSFEVVASSEYVFMQIR